MMNLKLLLTRHLQYEYTGLKLILILNYFCLNDSRVPLSHEIRFNLVFQSSN